LTPVGLVLFGAPGFLRYESADCTGQPWFTGQPEPPSRETVFDTGVFTSQSAPGVEQPAAVVMEVTGPDEIRTFQSLIGLDGSCSAFTTTRGGIPVAIGENLRETYPPPYGFVLQ
jgi:hypothetical protein